MKNRKGVKYPKGFMQIMKNKKHKKIRNIPIDVDFKEQYFNDAEMVL